MPTKKRPGMVGVYVELSEEQVAKLEELVGRIPLGSKADHIRLAIDRHIASPPGVIVPELPVKTVESPPAEVKPKRGRKGK